MVKSGIENFNFVTLESRIEETGSLRCFIKEPSVPTRKTQVTRVSWDGIVKYGAVCDRVCEEQLVGIFMS